MRSAKTRHGCGGRIIAINERKGMARQTGLMVVPAPWTVVETEFTCDGCGDTWWQLTEHAEPAKDQ